MKYLDIIKSDEKLIIEKLANIIGEKYMSSQYNYEYFYFKNAYKRNAMKLDVHNVQLQSIGIVITNKNINVYPVVGYNNSISMEILKNDIQSFFKYYNRKQIIESL